MQECWSISYSVCWQEKIRLNNQIKELPVPQFSYPWILEYNVSFLTHFPLSHPSEHSRKVQTDLFPPLKYKHEGKWYTAPHCLILIYIGSSRDSYLRKGIEKLSCTYVSQINSHFTSGKAVRFVKWHFIQWDRLLLALQGLSTKMSIWKFAWSALGQRY